MQTHLSDDNGQAQEVEHWPQPQHEAVKVAGTHINKMRYLLFGSRTDQITAPANVPPPKGMAHLTFFAALSQPRIPSSLRDRGSVIVPAIKGALIKF